MKKNKVLRESVIEAYLVSQVKKVGGWAPKWSSPSTRGVPDRIVFFPQRMPLFVEVKSSKGTLSVLQGRMIKKLQDMGQSVAVINSKEMVDELIQAYIESQGPPNPSSSSVPQ